MINRWIGIATLALMLSVNAALLVRDFLPDWMAGDPPATRALELRDGDEINTQFGIYDRNGNCIGRSWTRTKRDRELVLVRHRTVIESLYLPLETDFRTVRIETRLNFHEQARLDDLRINVYGLGLTVKLEGEFYLPDDFACTWQVGPQRGEFQLPAHATRAMGDFIRPFESLTGLYVGKTWRLQLLNPLSGVVPDWGTRNMATSGLLVRVTGTEEVEHRGEPVETFVVEAEGMKAWVTRSGRVVRQEFEVPLLGKLLLVDEPFDKALRGQALRDTP